MKKIFNDIRKLAGFEKDFKKLAKRYKTLEEDIDVVIEKQLNLTHKLAEFFSEFDLKPVA